MKKYYWIAVNRHSAALSPLPLSVKLNVIPTPQQLFGYESYEVARKVQEMLLCAPMEYVTEFMNNCGKQLQDGTAQFVYIRPPKADPPGPVTSWIENPETPRFDPSMN